MLGERKGFARRSYAPTAVGWTLTTTIAGEVAWIEEGVFDGSSTRQQDDDSSTTFTGTSDRRLLRRFIVNWGKCLIM